ncbi:zinc finger, BED-type containing 1 [Elysia marginata]|uniref:Zinc finger, BED-type containing 1 n=1 Tax=Elysia marginata TaxID=1093978 RepID=A0AAV4HJI1_9GAST|nr:zinc finger, BED-type containing 1 [Elysia marginata]
MEKFNVSDKVTTVVTDNARDMVNAVEVLNIRHVPCYAHTLNLILQRLTLRSGINIFANDEVRVWDDWRCGCLAAPSPAGDEALPPLEICASSTVTSAIPSAVIH